MIVSCSPMTARWRGGWPSGKGAILAKRLSAKVYLLSVVAESPGVRVGEAAYPGVIANTQSAYQQLFDEAIEGLQARGLQPAGRLVRGDPAVEISAYAREVGADVIVVGHRKKSLLERWWSGSTGAYLMDYVGCSLLIARRDISDEVFAAEMAAADGG